MIASVDATQAGQAILGALIIVGYIFGGSLEPLPVAALSRRRAARILLHHKRSSAVLMASTRGTS